MRKAVKQLPAGSWEVSIYLPNKPGKYSRFRRRYESEDRAKEVYHLLKAAIASGTWARAIQEIERNQVGDLTVEELKVLYFEQYCLGNNVAIKTKESRLRRITAHFGMTPVNQLSPFDVSRFVSTRRKTGAKGKNPKGVGARTINRDLAVLRHMLSWAVGQELIAENPLRYWKKLKETQAPPPQNLEKAIDEVFKHLDDFAKPLFTFIRETGCRRGEAVSLKHEQVLYDERLVLLTRTKSGKPRYLMLMDKAMEACQATPKVGEYVFYNPDTLDRWHDCRTPWERARTSAGYPSLKIKDLRTAFAMKLAELPGMEKHVIQTLLGHSDLATTERFYAFHNQKRAIQRALRVIENGKTAANESKSKVGNI